MGAKMLAGFLTVAEQVEFEELVTMVLEKLYEEDFKRIWVELGPNKEDRLVVMGFYRGDSGKPYESTLAAYSVPKGLSRENLIGLLGNRIGQLLSLTEFHLVLAAVPGRGFLLQDKRLYCEACGGRVKTLVFERGAYSDEVVTRCLSCNRDATVAV